MTRLIPKKGDYVQIDSSHWFVWTGKIWRLMTIDEQLEVSK